MIARFTNRARKGGNSLVITIPETICDLEHIENGDVIEVEILNLTRKEKVKQ